jgi:hypothetical protein
MKQPEQYKAAKLVASTLPCGLTCMLSRSPVPRTSPAPQAMNFSPVAPKIQQRHSVQQGAGDRRTARRQRVLHLVWRLEQGYRGRLGNRPYLTQQIWVNARGGYCAMLWDN